jgi:hypothetical protein
MEQILAKPESKVEGLNLNLVESQSLPAEIAAVLTEAVSSKLAPAPSTPTRP